MTLGREREAGATDGGEETTHGQVDNNDSMTFASELARRLEKEILQPSAGRIFNWDTGCSSSLRASGFWVVRNRFAGSGMACSG